ncbi:MAG: cysteine desulfurase [Syntrophotaleaceae bacterium]
MLDLPKIRECFPILTRNICGKPLVYLDNAATTQKPRQVLDKLLEFYLSCNSNIHRGVHTLSEQASGVYEDARENVRQFIHAAEPAEIVFTRGATESINLVAASFGEVFVGKEDEILVTEMEHHSNLVPWQNLCKRRGAVLKAVPFNDDGTLALDQLESMLTPRTRLLALTYVSNALGQINPVGEIVAQAHAKQVPVLIDGAQAVQHLPVDVQELDCDFFVFSGHKMYASTGIGVLYGKRRWLEQLPPWQYGGGMIERVDLEETTFGALPQKFEAGTPHVAGAVSLAAAIDFIREIGIGAIADHEADLMNYAVRQLQAVADLTLYGNGGRRCGAVSFNLKGLHPYDVGMILDKMGIAVRTGAHCAEPVMRHYGIGGTLRASFGLYNTREEINSLIFGLEKARKLLG